MELWVAKVISLTLIFILTLFFGLIPVKFVAFLRKREDRSPSLLDSTSVEGTSTARKILSYLNCFSGGVFFGTCLLHLFPEVTERYQKIHSSAHLEFDFPLNELIIACGFFLIMFIEHAAMSLHSRHRKQQVSLSISEERAPCLSASHTASARYGTSGQQTEEIHPNQIDVIADRLAEGPGACNTFMNSYNSNYECNAELPHHHHPGQTHEETVQIHAIRSLMLLVALSMHTAFEGLALGLEPTVAAVWTLFGAEAVHKSVIAFTMGLQFTDTFQQTSRVVGYMLLFSVVCPIGAAIGTGIAAVSDPGLALDVTSMTLQGLATGTFLYVTFFEVLQKELGVEEHSVTKVLMIMVGFAVIGSSNLLES